MEQDTITTKGEPCKLKVGGRHDASVIPRIVPVLKAMMQLVLADHLLRRFQIEITDHHSIIRDRLNGKLI